MTPFSSESYPHIELSTHCAREWFKLGYMNDVLITESRQFVADHYHSLSGFCEPRHGHNWETEVTVKYDCASSRLGSILDAWTTKVNYSLLNEQEAIAGRNPTAEVLAEWIFQYLAYSGLCPVVVQVREKSHYWAACMNYK